MSAQQKLKENNKLIHILTSKSSLIEDEFEVLKGKEQFYESFKKEFIRPVPDVFLNSLESKMTYICEKVKKEKQRRHYMQKIEVLQEQLLKLQKKQLITDGAH